MLDGAVYADSRLHAPKFRTEGAHASKVMRLFTHVFTPGDGKSI